jgi:proteasome lid subunit RPN8/RPN11
MNHALELLDEHRASICAHCAAGYPEEVCGVLIGESAGRRRRVARVVEAANVHTPPRRRRYTLDPLAMLAIVKQLRESDAEIIGYYHSHPDHPPQPSETDRALAWPGYVYVICAVQHDGTPQLAAWVLSADQFGWEPVAISAPARDFSLA